MKILWKNMSQLEYFYIPQTAIGGLTQGLVSPQFPE